MNHLANSTSPYLLQHANNPVNWYPWGNEALQKARDENKLILVSIGYSACHWCHVMEHESFEDASVATVMNEFFVCIKVDREERPDVDQVYMSAVQLMTGRGGWPLNCICLPDQRPIYGGTYFRKNDWTSLLFNLADFYKQKPDEAADYADKLTAGIIQYESVTFVKEQAAYNTPDLEKIVSNWSRYFDNQEGGMGSQPKFPMPNNWIFLMRYSFLMQHENIAQIVKLTLKKMAYGGIYDQVGGGFARYSVDKLWHIPHFEKMLYDNAQLISVYAEGYTWQKDNLYKNVVAETIEFVLRELTSPDNGFYSALDADSEGVEGKFYSFSKQEIVDQLNSDAQLFCIYYNVTDDGNWEEEHINVFYRRDDDEVLAAKIGIGTDELLDVIHRSKAKLLAARGNRIRPGLDNKILASWNGLMLKGLCDAYRAFGEQAYLDLALKNAEFIIGNLIDQHGKLRRIFKPSPPKEVLGEAGDAPIAFLDDYANVIEAFIALYEVTFDIQWLNKARALTDLSLTHYYDQANGMFFYTSDGGEQLIARKAEIMDGVISSSNSVMARNLKKLGLLFEDERYNAIAAQQLSNIFPMIAKYGSSYANWATMLMEEVFGLNEIAITGSGASALRKELEQSYIPDKIILGGIEENLPLLQGRVGELTRIYICKNKTCGLPVDNAAEALKQIRL
jgi:uncharacterized protein YyaL (SSP411 family)